MDKLEFILKEEIIEVIQEQGYFVFIIDGPIVQGNITPPVVDIREIFEGIKQIDGHGSGLDADLLDGKHATEFAEKIHTHQKIDIVDFAHTHAASDINTEGLDADTVDGRHAEDFAQADHTHDDRYYVKTEIDLMLSQKADKNHTHPESDYRKLLPFIIALGGI